MLPNMRRAVGELQLRSRHNCLVSINEVENHACQTLPCLLARPVQAALRISAACLDERGLMKHILACLLEKGHFQFGLACRVH